MTIKRFLADSNTLYTLSSAKRREVLKRARDLFPAEHDVGGSLQAVDDGLATGVQVVVLVFNDLFRNRRF
jgi:hypothetical protein